MSNKDRCLVQFVPCPTFKKAINVFVLGDKGKLTQVGALIPYRGVYSFTSDCNNNLCRIHNGLSASGLETVVKKLEELNKKYGVAA